MNVTDIDDKIIRRARREHLFAQYIGRVKGLRVMVADITEAMEVRVWLCLGREWVGWVGCGT